MFCRFLVDSHWFKQWKKFAGYDSWDKFEVGQDLNNPGPIDNSSLFEGKKQYFKGFDLCLMCVDDVFLFSWYFKKGEKSLVVHYFCRKEENKTPLI